MSNRRIEARTLDAAPAGCNSSDGPEADPFDIFDRKTPDSSRCDLSIRLIFSPPPPPPVTNSNRLSLHCDQATRLLTHFSLDARGRAPYVTAFRTLALVSLKEGQIGSGADTKGRVFANRGLAGAVYDVGIPRCVTYSPAIGIRVSGIGIRRVVGRAARN